VKSIFSTAHDIFKPLQNCSIFKCISWVNGSFFLGVNIGVFWKRESRPIEWRQFRLLTRQLFLCLHIYSLWFVLGHYVTQSSVRQTKRSCSHPRDMEFEQARYQYDDMSGYGTHASWLVGRMRRLRAELRLPELADVFRRQPGLERAEKIMASVTPHSITLLLLLLLLWCPLFHWLCPFRKSTWHLGATPITSTSVRRLPRRCHSTSDCVFQRLKCSEFSLRKDWPFLVL
jgi:hypothetical protein